MKENNIKISIKNMVCNRCVKVIKDELKKNNIDFIDVNLGTIQFQQEISEEDTRKLKSILIKEGFELLETRDAKIVSQAKFLIIDAIHHQRKKPSTQNFSEFLSINLKVDYSHLSKVFSEIEGKTIEHFTIEQKVERAKELLLYNELTLSQISYELNYSSPQHLSRQFKKVTGITPTQFKNTGKRKKLDTI
ncbi:MAG: AraC family transcriptional regulator [Flavobacteriaceae bacterium]|nr:AraC family transcriptional regulator [Flavobacteriaceae bacterium]